MIIASLSLNYFATSFLDSDTLQEESFQSFNKSGNSYLNNTNTISYNWKFGLIILLQNCQNVKKMAKMQKEGDCVEELFI